MAGLHIAARYLPMGEVAGDFYDVISTTSGGVGLLVADVSGHGVPVALITSMVKIAFAAETDRIDDPGRVLQGLNQTLCGKFDRAFITAFCGVLDPAGRRFRYASAGHPPALVRRREGRLERLEEHGMILAVMPGSTYTIGDVVLAPGDRLVIVTMACSKRKTVLASFLATPNSTVCSTSDSAKTQRAPPMRWLRMSVAGVNPLTSYRTTSR